MAAAVMACASACGEPHEVMTTAEIDQAVEQFSADFATAMCALNDRCNLGLLPVDTDYCRAFVTSTDFVIWGAALPSGARTIDTEATAACLSYLETLDCTRGWEVLYADANVLQTACQRAVWGTTGEGDPCSDHVECAWGSWCDASETCPGTCQSALTRPRVPKGEPCRDSWECEWGLLCVAGFCALGPDVGEPCAGEELECREGLTCGLANASSHICEVQPFALTLGTGCWGTFQCGNGLFCLGDPWTPYDPSLPIAPTCWAAGQAGEPCGPELPPCDWGLGCMGSEGDPTCAAKEPNGAPCSADDTCLSEVCRDGACASWLRGACE